MFLSIHPNTRTVAHLNLHLHHSESAGIASATLRNLLHLTTSLITQNPRKPFRAIIPYTLQPSHNNLNRMALTNRSSSLAQ